MTAPANEARERQTSHLVAIWRLRAYELGRAGAGIAAQCLRECAEELEALNQGREPDRTSSFAHEGPPADLAARAAWHKQQWAECLRQIGEAP